MKSLNYLLVIIIICVLDPGIIYCQSNFKTGYILNSQNDTIKGFIDYRNWDKSPKEIAFKENSGINVTVYNPYNIKGFSVAGERYISGIVTIDKSPWNDNELTESEQTQFITDTVFLQILIDGRKGLCYLKDENKKLHFFISQDGQYETLIRTKHLSNVDGHSYIQINEKFKGQLNTYLQDCPSVQKMISGTGYSQKDLIKLFDEYYKCNKEEINYKPESEKIKTEFGIFGGLSLTKLKLVGSFAYFSSLINTDYKWTDNFTFGVFNNILLPRKQGKWSFTNELMFSVYKASGINLDSTNADIYTKTYSSIGASYIKLNTLLKFKFPVKGIFLFMDGGISNGIGISKTNYFRSENHVYSTNNISEAEALHNPRRWEKGFLLGIGSSLKNISFEFRFERADGMSTYELLSSPVTRYFFILGYRF